MGYTTKFKGTLKFKELLTPKHILTLNAILGEDCHDHPLWNAGKNVNYIDLRLTNDLSGLEWNSAEKSHNMAGQINTVIKLMESAEVPIALEGGFLAQGEEVGDVYKIVMENNIAVVHEIKI